MANGSKQSEFRSRPRSGTHAHTVPVVLFLPTSNLVASMPVFRSTEPL